MRRQVLILSLIGLLWAEGFLVIAGARGGIVALPPAISGLLVLAGWKTIGPSALPAQDVGRIGRAVRIWFLIEAAAIVGAIVVLNRLHAPGLIPGTILILVGLHFVPLARQIPQPFYYATGAVMVAAGLLSVMVLPASLQMLAPLAAGTMILWGTAVAIIVANGNRAPDPNLREG